MQRIPSTSIATVRPPTGGDEQDVGPTHLEQPHQESAQAQELGSFILRRMMMRIYSLMKTP